MAVRLGPAWPQLSPLQPGTGKQGVFTFRWDLGACMSVQMSFVPLGCAGRPCKEEGAGHGFGATQQAWIWAGVALWFRAQGRTAEQQNLLLMLSLPYPHGTAPVSPALPRFQSRLSSGLFCSW